MHFIPPSLNSQLPSYGPFTDMSVKCSLATFQHFDATKRVFKSKKFYVTNKLTISQELYGQT